MPDDNWLKYAGITLGTSTVAGLLFYWARRDNQEMMEIERTQYMLEALRTQVNLLKAQVRSLEAELETFRTTNSSNSPTNKRPSSASQRNVTFSQKSSPPSSSDSSQRQRPLAGRDTKPSSTTVVRTPSILSITSDGEYADAEDEWYPNF